LPTSPFLRSLRNVRGREIRASHTPTLYLEALPEGRDACSARNFNVDESVVVRTRDGFAKSVSQVVGHATILALENRARRHLAQSAPIQISIGEQRDMACPRASGDRQANG